VPDAWLAPVSRLRAGPTEAVVVPLLLPVPGLLVMSCRPHSLTPSLSESGGGRGGCRERGAFLQKVSSVSLPIRVSRTLPHR
jgi:hypothetical protein